MPLKLEEKRDFDIMLRRTVDRSSSVVVVGVGGGRNGTWSSGGSLNGQFEGGVVLGLFIDCGFMLLLGRCGMSGFVFIGG